MIVKFICLCFAFHLCFGDLASEVSAFATTIQSELCNEVRLGGTSCNSYGIIDFVNSLDEYFAKNTTNAQTIAGCVFFFVSHIFLIQNTMHAAH